ncbi:hypothetical protein E2C01_009212 [Portunus trituberculatus]|uniref:Uncharacterized protein n=1 Tax=Portunus trituberculatus TaxID=210409 RepID=A0A5B7D2V4_PORTR|nr:hypothetical protein [Portunus trituberculatus]
MFGQGAHSPTLSAVRSHWLVCNISGHWHSLSQGKTRSFLCVGALLVLFWRSGKRLWCRDLDFRLWLRGLDLRLRFRGFGQNGVLQLDVPLKIIFAAGAVGTMLTLERLLCSVFKVVPITVGLPAEGLVASGADVTIPVHSFLVKTKVSLGGKEFIAAMRPPLLRVHLYDVSIHIALSIHDVITRWTFEVLRSVVVAAACSNFHSDPEREVVDGDCVLFCQQRHERQLTGGCADCQKLSDGLTGSRKA